MKRTLMRALTVAAIVGTALSAIHCRQMFSAEGLRAFCHWQVFTSYLVPFVVSLVSAHLARS